MEQALAPGGRGGGVRGGGVRGGGGRRYELLLQLDESFEVPELTIASPGILGYVEQLQRRGQIHEDVHGKVE